MAERLSEDRTITGANQEKWPLDGFKNSTQRWDILGQQAFVAEKDRTQARDRRRLHGRVGRLRRVAPPYHPGSVDADVRNAVVLTGDVHRNWANDLKVDYKDPAPPWSARNWSARPSTPPATAPANHGSGDGLEPALKFYNDNRGYVNTKITKDALTADFRVLDHVTTRASPPARKPRSQSRTRVPGLQAR